MSLIYEPEGRAREYSPLALNVYTGCDHNCRYCYVQHIQFRGRNGDPTPKKNILDRLKTELNHKEITSQVLLCFIGDPYCHADVQYRTTREVLKIMLKHQVPTTILTKGGNRCLRDADYFAEFESIKVGATLTSLDGNNSQYWEPDAALSLERIDTLKTLHAGGIRTWVSLEPVLDPEESLKIIDETHEFIDEFKLGKLNHFSEIEAKINWEEYVEKGVSKLRKYRKEFYVKKDLAGFANGVLFRPEEIDMDFLTLRKTSPKQGELSL